MKNLNIVMVATFSFFAVQGVVGATPIQTNS
jgi:hypothetical protein